MAASSRVARQRQGGTGLAAAAVAAGRERTAPRRNKMRKVVAIDIAAPDRVASVRSVGSFL